MDSTLHALATSAPSRDGGPRFGGKWKNQLESTMELHVHGSKVTGEYVSKESETGRIERGPIVGFVDGDLISFVVNWSKAASMTAWVGQLVGDANKPELRTLWHLVVDIPDAAEPKKLWTSILTGADTFTQA